jgi:hypothetical protein
MWLRNVWKAIKSVLTVPLLFFPSRTRLRLIGAVAATRSTWEAELRILSQSIKDDDESGKTGSVGSKPSDDSTVQTDDSSTLTNENWVPVETRVLVLKNCLHMLKEAQELAESGDIDTGWQVLQAALRHEIEALDDASVVARAVEIRHEVTKLSENRQNAVLALLGDVDKSNFNYITRAWTIHAAQIRDEHFANLYFKIRKLGVQFRVLALCLVATLGLIVFAWLTDGWYSIVFDLDSIDKRNQDIAAQIQTRDINPTEVSIADSIAIDTAGSSGATVTDSAQKENAPESTESGDKKDLDDDEWKAMLSGVMLFGLLGALLSASFSLARLPLKSTIPQQMASWYVTLMRLVLGVGSAVVVFVALNSEFSPDVVTKTINTPAGYYLVAFASGFSERLVRRAAAAAEAEKKK